MNFSSFFKSKKFYIITWSVAGVIILLLTFKVGVIVGYKKASFSYRWGENYHRNFAGPGKGFLHDVADRNFIESHGTFGQIIKKDGTTLVVRSREMIEKIITIANDTVIRSGRDTATLNDLNVNDYIVIIGAPNTEGQIEAKFIRIMTNMPTIYE